MEMLCDRYGSSIGEIYVKIVNTRLIFSLRENYILSSKGDTVKYVPLLHILNEWEEGTSIQNKRAFFP
jgi:hypothetical protein